MSLPTSTIEVKTVTKELPIFITSINQHGEALRLATEAIFEEKIKNPTSMKSNVKAHYVSDHSSHIHNSKFEPLIDVVISFCEEISKTHFNCNLKFRCLSCWGMIYEENDYTQKHSHFPSTFAAVVYLDSNKDSSSITIEDQLNITPTPGSLLVLPGLLDHEVFKTNGKRIAVGMNIEYVL